MSALREKIVDLFEVFLIPHILVDTNIYIHEYEQCVVIRSNTGIIGVNVQIQDGLYKIKFGCIAEKFPIIMEWFSKNNASEFIHNKHYNKNIYCADFTLFEEFERFFNEAVMKENI